MGKNRLNKEFSETTTRSLWQTYGPRRRKILGFMAKNKNGDEVGSVTTVLVEEYRVYYKNIFIDSLNSELYALIKPVSITLEHYGNVYVAVNYDLDIYGYGDTEVEAIDELKSLIIEFYEDLKEEKNLAPIPGRMMIFYKEIIKEK